MLTVRPLLTGTAYLTESRLFSPVPPGSDDNLVGPLPVYVYHLFHSPTSTHLLWDLGLPPDLSSSPLAIRELFPIMKPSTEPGKDTASALRAQGIDPAEIKHLIYSHIHFDHTGDISSIPNAQVYFGAGTRAAHAPGWPADESSSTDGRVFSETEGRYNEVSFDATFGVEPWPQESVHDFFGDGSLLLINAPGHTTGHMIALAKVAEAPAERWVLLGGDCCHHARHEWEWDTEKGGRMGYGMHEEPEVARGTLAKVAEWTKRVEGAGGRVVRGMAHTSWWEEGKPL